VLLGKVADCVRGLQPSILQYYILRKNPWQSLGTFVRVGGCHPGNDGLCPTGNRSIMQIVAKRVPEGEPWQF
jgi:hypothetical protein